MSQTIGRLRVVLVGRAKAYTRPQSTSAIDKRALSGTVTVTERGLDGDEQGDTRVHGGPDKAVHCYPWSHYAAWRRELPGVTAQKLLAGAGAFGENFSLEGLDESRACIGDRWAIGEALFEVSQGRQPCWKLNDRFDVPDMAHRVQRSLRAGWYLRVLRAGRVRAGDEIRLFARPYPDWSLDRLLRVIAEREHDPLVLSQIVALPLTRSWAKLFGARLASGQVESWALRMAGEDRSGSA